MDLVLSRSRCLPLVCTALLCGACGEEDGASPSELLRGGGDMVREAPRSCVATGFSAHVMDAVKNFGAASYLWKGYGVTRTITYKSKVLATPYKIAGDPKDYCYCVGATFQIYMTAFENWDKQNGNTGDLKGLSASQAETLRKIWYIVDAKYEKGAAEALTSNGLGQAIPKWSDARTGDFVQFWRHNKSGHSAVFSGWKYTGSTITGITYFSCQGSGAGYASETIGSGAKQIDASRLYISRASYPGATKPDSGGVKPDSGAQKDSGPSKDSGVKLDSGAQKDSGARKDSGAKKDSKPAPVLDGPLPTLLDGAGPGARNDELQGSCAVAAGDDVLALVLLGLGLLRWRRCRKRTRA